MLLYHPISIFTFEIFYIYLAFTSYFRASVLADEEVVMIAQCARSLKRAMINLIRGKQSIIYLEKEKSLRRDKGNALSNYYR